MILLLVMKHYVNSFICVISYFFMCELDITDKLFAKFICSLAGHRRRSYHHYTRK